MDHKKSPMRRTKRQSKVLEDNYWDCSVCTYRNNAEAFKCLMCDVRKGTSTRKPRINPALAASQQQAGPASATAAAPGGGSSASSTASSNSKRLHQSHPPRLKNVDRSSAQTREVTVNSVTVVITEYKPIAVTQLQQQQNAAASSESSDRGSLSESSDATRS
ncbi:YY1-associated factor 2 isoform X2 [Ctenocephalides felis]|uniref:YY1-associated factor 2 isoform X2 n=1 Tax=Ctenocephalides felis TaxID=7515 RepID=UPI000E6E4FBF|nr:YY1-associated factor 2 isoform X2 [Ctenocephalides felis]